MATFNLVQEREAVDSGYVAVDNITSASPSTIQSAFTILRSGTVNSPVEIMLRVATIQDFNTLTINPLNRLDSAAWLQLNIESQTPQSIVFDTIPDTWQTISNTTKLIDTANSLEHVVFPSPPPQVTLSITAGYGSASNLTPINVPVIMGASKALYIADPGIYFPNGPSNPSVPITYSLGVDPQTNYTDIFGPSPTGQILYNDTYNITQQYNATTNIPPQFSPVFPSATYVLPTPAPVANQPYSINQPSNFSSQINPLIGVPSTTLFINRTIFPTNISVWSGIDGTGAQLNWYDVYGNYTTVLNDAIVVRTDNGASTMFLDSQFYSFFSTADLALSHSISVSQYLQTLLAQESENLSNVTSGPLLGLTNVTLNPLPTSSSISS